MTKKNLEILKTLTEELMSHLGVEHQIDFEEDPENEAIKVKIETPDSGILIGYHGETLSALQLLLGIMYSHQTGVWTRVIIDVGDYREKREEILRRMAFSAAQKAKFSGEPVALPPLKSAERRIIHLILTDNPDVTSESEGEGENRQVVIKPKK